MGGVSYLQPRMQSFREKEFNALGRGIGNSRIRPVIHVRKKSNASMPWERSTPKPSLPHPSSKSSYAIVQLPWIPHLANEGGYRLTPSNPAPVPTDPRELPHERSFSPELFGLISIVHRTLSRISKAWPSHPRFPSRRDFHLEKNSRSIWARGVPYERPVLFQYQSRTPWPMCPPRRHLWQTCGHRHEVPQMQPRSWCEHVWSTAQELSHWKNMQSAQPKQKGKGRRGYWARRCQRRHLSRRRLLRCGSEDPTNEFFGRLKRWWWC